MIRKPGLCVPPRSRGDIRSTALLIRDVLDLSNGVKMAHFLDIVVPQIIPDFYFEVKEVSEMGEDHARTFPDGCRMEIRRDIYDNASMLTPDSCDLYGRDNFTLAHEFGHLILHKGATSYARGRAQRNHKVYEDSEWQADTFAAEFLMPFDKMAEINSVYELQRRYLVGYQAASIRLDSKKKG